jgi:gamma-glutamylputrescine oxidase
LSLGLANRRKRDSGMLLEPWWYTRSTLPPRSALNGRASCDVVVIGGGIAGLHAALSLAERGADVILLERSFCGAGMSGKSSGFLTPDSELELHDLVMRFGPREAATLWEIATAGVELIVHTAQKHSIECELLPLDSLFVGLGGAGAARVNAEAAARAALGYSYTKYSAQELGAVHTGDYSGGVHYGGTWAMNPLAYCLGVRAALSAAGVRIYEGSEVTALHGTTAITPNGAVSAGKLVSCMNQIRRRVDASASRKAYHAQTFLAVSEPLSGRHIDALFPAQPLQVWDTALVYSYHRLTGDNRLLLGGGSPVTTFAPWEIHSPHVIASVIERFKTRVPTMRDLRFERFWPGLIDITHDLLPLAAANPDNGSVYYVLGCAGIPWAAWCGEHVARLVAREPTTDVSRFFGWNRPQLIPNGLQAIAGKPLSFAIDVLRAKKGRPEWKGNARSPTGAEAVGP